MDGAFFREDVIDVLEAKGVKSAIKVPFYQWLGLNERIVGCRDWDRVHSTVDCFEQYLPVPVWSRKIRVVVNGNRVAHPTANNYAGTTIVSPFDTYAAFCVLQSRPHEVWPRFFGSTLLNAYGWTEFPIDRDFLLDYEFNEVNWDTKKKPYRHHWPDEIRDEVLARLLALNDRVCSADHARASSSTRSAYSNGGRTAGPVGSSG